MKKHYFYIATSHETNESIAGIVSIYVWQEPQAAFSRVIRVIKDDIGTDDFFITGFERVK